MKRLLQVSLILAVLTWIWAGSTYLMPKQQKAEVGKVTAHLNGLHGYISFSVARPPVRADYGAGMGFYSAVWPLIDGPIENFQIGLAGAWITPDNSDNKKNPLAPIGTYARDHWPDRGGCPCRPSCPG